MVNKNGLTDRAIEGVDPILLDFVKTNANSFVKWELMKFFDQNPDSTNTAENIANCIVRKISVVKPALDELAESGILKGEILNGVSVYSLGSDGYSRTLVNKFSLAFEDRYFRVYAVNQIIPGLR
jgi:hypothetical protein